MATQKQKNIDEYTIADLCDMLPESLSNDIGTYYLVVTKKNGKWKAVYEGLYEGIKPDKFLFKVLQDLVLWLRACEYI